MINTCFTAVCKGEGNELWLLSYEAGLFRIDLDREIISFIDWIPKGNEQILAMQYCKGKIVFIPYDGVCFFSFDVKNKKIYTKNLPETKGKNFWSCFRMHNKCVFPSTDGKCAVIYNMKEEKFDYISYEKELLDTISANVAGGIAVTVEVFPKEDILYTVYGTNCILVIDSFDLKIKEVICIKWSESLAFAYYYQEGFVVCTVRGEFYYGNKEHMMEELYKRDSFKIEDTPFNAVIGDGKKYTFFPCLSKCILRSDGTKIYEFEKEIGGVNHLGHHGCMPAAILGEKTFYFRTKDGTFFLIEKKSKIDVGKKIIDDGSIERYKYGKDIVQEGIGDRNVADWLKYIAKE